jgi:carbon monoxide dehydrogenase subunit G
LRLSIEGKGLSGFVKGQGELAMVVKESQTEVTYTGDAQVGGLIASVGQRMIEATAKKIIEQFFESAAKELSQNKE